MSYGGVLIGPSDSLTGSVSRFSQILLLSGLFRSPLARAMRCGNFFKHFGRFTALFHRIQPHSSRPHHRPGSMSASEAMQWLRDIFSDCPRAYHPPMALNVLTRAPTIGGSLLRNKCGAAANYMCFPTPTRHPFGPSLRVMEWRFFHSFMNFGRLSLPILVDHSQ
jgi:hypothetical protein